MKLYRTLFLILALSIIVWDVHAQRGNIWCFGDSAAMDFNGGTPVPSSSSVLSRGSCVSIANTNGDLLLYAHTRSGAGGVITGLIYNSTNQLMMDGDSIAGGGWYQEMVIVPNPADDSSYYLFTVGVTMQFGLMYSIIDMRGDGGLGAVTQKNVQLLNFLLVDCILAIKHGNGRDWWLLVRPSPVGFMTNNIWHKFLIDPSGITAMPNQNLGTLNQTNSGRLTANSDGDKISFVTSISLIELYNFNRCTGLITSPVQIEPPLSIGPYPYYWSSEFSSSGRYLYVSSTTMTVSKLWQYDTWSPNIFATKTLIWQTPGPPFTAGALKRGPDDKIYFSCAWAPPNGSSSYPYDSTEYFTENMNLGVINSPDSAGLACDFQPWSFYLSGKRTYWGLPNNPDYDLPALAGSPCDTLVSQNELAGAAAVGSLHVYYHPAWEKAFINASNLKGKTGILLVYDMQGKVVHSEPLRIQNGYYTRDLSMIGKAEGVYLVVVETEQERFVKKVMVD
jgi:hypothetical protein